MKGQYSQEALAVMPTLEGYKKWLSENYGEEYRELTPKERKEFTSLLRSNYQSTRDKPTLGLIDLKLNGSLHKDKKEKTLCSIISNLLNYIKN